VDFADFLLGAPDSFIQASKTNPRFPHKIHRTFCAGQAGGVTSNLTFNYGVRWEVSQPVVRHAKQNRNNYSRTAICAFPRELLWGGWSPAIPAFLPTLAPTKYNAFAPRLGLAYSPNKSEGWLSKITGGPGKMTIRAGLRPSSTPRWKT